MTRIVHGVVHGNTIQLDENLGIEEGQVVEVQIRKVSSPQAWGAGLARCAGALAEDGSDRKDSEDGRTAS